MFAGFEKSVARLREAMGSSHTIRICIGRETTVIQHQSPCDFDAAFGVSISFVCGSEFRKLWGRTTD